MSVSERMRERGGEVPPRLALRVDEVLNDVPNARAGDATSACLDAAWRQLRELLARSSAGRESALDLLTVDALVTYAFEAAAENPETLREHATGAAARFAASVGSGT